MAFNSGRTYRRATAYSTILKATFIAGTLDIIIALLQFYFQNKRNPLVVLKFIASAVFGKAAFMGGTEMDLWGLLLHFAVTLVWAILFFMIFPKLNAITGNFILTGIVYALLVWACMNLIVLPMTQLPSMPFNWRSAATGVLILIIAIGLPFSFIMKKHFETVDKH